MIYTFVPWYEKTIPDPILGHKIYLCLAGADRLEILSSVCRTFRTTSGNAFYCNQSKLY